MNNKMLGQLFGGILVLIAILLAVVQHFNVYNLYGDVGYKWSFYGLVGVIGIVGVVIASWSYIKK